MNTQSRPERGKREVGPEGPKARRSLIDRIEASLFPLTPQNIAFALGMWVLVAVSLPTSALAFVGPYRVVAVVFDSLGWGDAFEWMAVVLITGAIVLLTAGFAVMLTRVVLVTAHRHVQIAIPAGLALAAVLTAGLIVNPTYMIGGLQEDTVTYRNFAFGSFPSKERFEELGEQGYTIVSLVHPAVLPFESRLLEIERGWAEGEGVGFISIPMMPWMSQNEAGIATIQDLALNGNGRYYVHCWFGFHRTMDVRTLVVETIDPGSPDAAPPADYGPGHLDFSLPDLRLIVLLGPVAALFAMTLGWVVVRLRTAYGMTPSGTRKVIHVSIFTAAAIVQLAFGFPGVLLYGGIVGAALAYAAWRGRGFDLYDAVARGDAEKRRQGLVLLPFAATGVGGLAVNLLFYPVAALGYLVNGFGDAAGEIVGRRFGKTRYTVPLPFGLTAHRSLEGSIGVFIVATLAALVGIALTADAFVMPTMPTVLIAALAIGGVAAVVEAVSGGGIDNFTIQFGAAATAFVS